VPLEVTSAYRALCSTLLELPEQREDGELVPLVVPFDDAARGALEDFSRELETRLGAGGDLAAISDWANKLAGGVARIAGLLHFAELRARAWSDESAPTNSGYFGNYGNQDQTQVVTTTCGTVCYETTCSSVTIGRYLLDHAQSAFALIGADPEIAHAQRILAWVERAGISRFSKRDAWQATRGYFKKAGELEAPLRLLCEHGYLREEQPERPVLAGARERSLSSILTPAIPIIPKTRVQRRGHRSASGVTATVLARGHGARSGTPHRAPRRQRRKIRQGQPKSVRRRASAIL
jgi:replicative DNA helicase